MKQRDRDWEHFKVMEEEENKEDAHLPGESKLKRLAVILGGIFLILLMLSFVVVTFPVGDIIKGILQSAPLQENKLNLGELEIIFTDDALSRLQDIYFAEQKVEFSTCLSGTKAGSQYFINSLYVPIMMEQTFNHVRFERCTEETLIMLHSHPYKSCVASETDIKTLNEMKRRNPDILMVIMCEPERFSVYG